MLPFLLLISIILLANCCDKDDKSELPPITQTGENTFGFLVDGELWLPKGQLIYTPELSVILERENDIRIWEIIANRTASSGFGFRVPEKSMTEGVVDIAVVREKDLGIFFHLSEKFPQENFYWNKDLPGELFISNLDTINRIVSGTFWFDLISGKGTKVEIRDGRFDLHINDIHK